MEVQKEDRPVALGSHRSSNIYAVFMAIKLGEKTLGKVAIEKEVPSLKLSFLQFPGFHPQHHKNTHTSTS